MAAKFRCDVCLKEFDYKYRYERHVETTFHKDKVRLMEICASTEAKWESGNVDTGGSSTVTESHSPSAIASDELSLAIGDEDIGHLDEAEKDSESNVANILSLTNSSANKEGQYHPFLSMISAMAYILIHSPHPIGLSNLTFVCHTLRCMFPALPSVSTMVSYRLPGYRAPEKFYSPSGVPFYVNSIAETIKLCLANPDIAKKMERYPVLPKKGFSREIFHGLQWRNDTRFQAPMATSPVGSVFLKDIVQSSIAGAICVSIIKQFYRKEGHNGIFASVQVLQVHPSELNTYILSDVVEIPVSTIVTILPQMDSRTRHVYKKGHDGSLTIVSDNELAEMSSPHPLKTRSIMCGSLPVFMVPLIIFSNDTSGNRSKVWNKFDSWCFLLAGLRQKDNAQFCNIHFICRDFKFLAQIAMFIFSPYLSEAEIEVWLALSMVFKMVYCDEFEPQKIDLYRDVCHRFARAIDCYSVTWRKKLKIHLILHLPDSMLRFGPASSFNTERCGEDLVNLYHTKEVQAFLGGEVQELALPHCTGVKFEIPCGNRTVNFASISSNDIVFPSNVIGTEANGAFVLAEHCKKVELETGLFIGSFHTEQATFCLVRYLEPVLMGTEPALNEWSCPLLTLTNVIRCIASTLVSCAVSVVHQCDSQCVLAEQETTSRIERELVTQKKTVFVHNTDNNMYCYNIFCMHCLP
ncbi:hypothetical protein EMCRGX_G020888 [Ephydatia muelleri]